MSRSLSHSILWLLIIFIPSQVIAQSPNYGAANWQLLDWQKDGVRGTSVNRAFDELLKGKKSQPVIVAVIDGGLDTAHEDLKGHIWTNQHEIPGNGVDDDHNGYADDIHGWNFLGGKDGRNMTTESLEQDREYYRLYPVYANVKDSSQVGNNGKAEYSYWLKIKAQHKKDSLQNALVVTFMPKMLKRLHSADSILHTQTHRDSNYVKDIDSVHISDSASRVILRDARALMVNNNVPPTMSIGAWVADGYRYLDDRKSRLKQESDDPNAERHEIVGDDPDNINDRNYGNNNIAAGAPLHGTHVAGIIAAIRGNGMGSDGITDNVLIMAVRAAPMGDEHDKDIALAIRCAVGNGARVINMSFGKFYSPGKKWVDEALQYAETKDVLLVHGAGNDGIDIDTAAFFPTPEYVNSHERAGNFITVGATQGGPDSLLVAGFSNFGAKEVDLFAPGFQIYSTVPGNKYEFESGTSMASPVVAGIAALIMEYYPALSARQVKYVLEESVMKIPDLKVKLPGSKTKVDFASMSKSQGIVNAYNALELAATLKGERKLTNGKQSSTHFVRQ